MTLIDDDFATPINSRSARYAWFMPGWQFRYQGEEKVSANISLVDTSLTVGRST